ncbi:MAG: cohesin domain-containing protein, partial [bacterium]
MQKALAVVFLLSFPVCVLAQEKKQFAFSHADKANAASGLKVDVNKKPAAFIGDEKPATSDNSIKPHSGNGTQAQGPGTFLMNSYYDYGSNGGVLSNIVDYGDGTLAVARMGATQPNLSDRGTYWAYFDGRAWSPMTLVETILRGWSNLATLADGRSVTVSHIANEVNVDTLKGVGVWRSAITGFATPTQAVWPRLTVDGRNNIIICSTLNGTEAGFRNRKEVAISRDRGLTWSHRILLPDTTTHLPQFSADDQAIDSFGDKIAIAAAERGGDVHLWQSNNNGQTWSYRNVTNYPTDIPVSKAEIRPWDTCDLIYDNAGNLHIFWEAVLATQDLPGTPIELFYDRNVGIQHWSQIAGITQAVTWADIPGSALESDNTLFGAGGPFQQINADATLTMQPQLGVDAAGNLYMLFAAYRPLDFDSDSTHFTDIYAVGSLDGGATWGPPANVTNTPKSEDLWASLADNIGDSLRFVYQSDDNTGNGIQGGGATPTTFRYYAFDKTNIRFPRPPVAISLPDSLTGSPGQIVNVPISLALGGNSIAALGVNIKATNKILSFAGFARGPIIPGERFNVNAPTPDSVILAFTDFGSGPIQQDGVLATLQFQISPQAEIGAIAKLDFSEVFASDPQFVSLPIQTGVGRVTVVIQPVTVSIADTLAGAPGDTIAVPMILAGAEHPIEALGAAIKATNDLLSFVDFVPGPIIPGATLNVNAPAPDSVRL